MQMQQCPHCGAAVPAGDRFCGECGRALSDVPAAPSPAASDAPAQPPAIPSWQPPPQPPARQPQVANVATPAVPSRAGTGLMSAGSLVSGTLGLCSSFMGCGFLFGLIGIVLGALSINSPQRTVAIIGVAVSVIALLISLAFVAGGTAGDFWQAFSDGISLP